MAAPVFQALGAIVQSAAGLSVGWPTHVANDIGLLVVTTKNEALGAIPSGFEHVSGSPIGTGTPAAAGDAVMLHVLWKRAASGAEPSANIGDSGDHQAARILTFRGCRSTGNPVNISAADVLASAGTAVNIPAAVTTANDCYVVAIVGHGIDTSSDQYSSVNWANAALASITELSNYSTAAGFGSGSAIAGGVKTVAGNYGVTTQTQITSGKQARLSLALEPEGALVPAALGTKARRLFRPGNVGPFARAWRQRPQPAYTGGELSFSFVVFADTFVTGWLVADGLGKWFDLPASWIGWTEWNHLPKSPITYTREIDIGTKIIFLPLVTLVTDGAQVIEEQHSDDASSWSSWAAIGPQVDARYIRIRVTISGPYPKIKTMRIILSATPITEFIEDQNTGDLDPPYRLGVGDVRLPIVKAYSAIKNVNISLQSVGAGWTWELMDKDTTIGPRVRIYNQSNALADAIIDAHVIGV